MVSPGPTCQHCGIALPDAAYVDRPRVFCCHRCALRAQELRRLLKQVERSYLMTVEALAAALAPTPSRSSTCRRSAC
ncbi:MAG: hypothetical protein HY660_12740 [Armatimonadetes bacterium]|nr:hypothetical protein [Armatimonadota bacterium]